MLFTHKYQPQSLKEIKGQEKAVQELHSCLVRNQSVILHGGVGNGKTSSVYAAASDLDVDVFELNSSDFRNKESLSSVLSGVVFQQGLFGRKKIILIDDVDALSGVKDRGGLQVLVEFVRKSPYPFVFTAYHLEDSKFKPLKRLCKVITFDPVASQHVFEVLQSICKREGMLLDDVVLKSLSRKSNGDVRSALNELQMMVYAPELVDFSYKDARSNLREFLTLTFKSVNKQAISQSFDSLEENFDEIFLWLEENIPYAYSVEDFSRAYDSLSRSDVFKGRIRRRQYYRFMVYQKYFMSMGVALAKSSSNKSFSSYKRNSKLLKIWMANRKYTQRNLLAEKIGEEIHLSKKKTVKELPFMTFLED